MDDAFDDTAYDTVLDDGLGHGGLPQDRAAKLAARRAFVDMKLVFLRATASLEDRKGQWLRLQVRQASDPMDLWLLRGPVLRALSQDDFGHRALRAELYRGLDSIFPEAFGFEPGASLPPTMPAPWEALAREHPQARAGAPSAPRGDQRTWERPFVPCEPRHSHAR